MRALFPSIIEVSLLFEFFMLKYGIMDINNKFKVAIVIPTKNRSDFLIRQLNYYASVNSPHPIYIADSSDQDHADRLKETISRLQNQLEIIYQPYPQNDHSGYTAFLFSLVKEKYVCFNGDDDFQVADTLTKSADFLEKNPDYDSASGRSITFKTKDNKAFGELKEIHDYPRYAIESATASQRLIDFMNHYYTTMVSTSRTENIQRYWLEHNKPENYIKDDSFRDEITPCAFSLVAGKSKVLDSLGFVHQIHDHNNPLPDIFDWITHENWRSSYLGFKNKLINELIRQDGIGEEEAERVLKIAFWSYLKIHIPKIYNEHILSLRPKKNQEDGLSLRRKIALRFPIVKKSYRRLIRPILGKKMQLHYEVLQPSSPYYKDFKPIINSLVNKTQLP